MLVLLLAAGCLPLSVTALATMLPKDASEPLMLAARLPAALRTPPAVARTLALLLLGTMKAVAYAMAGWALAWGPGVLLEVAVAVLLWPPAAGDVALCWLLTGSDWLRVTVLLGPAAVGPGVEGLPGAPGLLAVAGVVVVGEVLVVVVRLELLLSVGVTAGPGASLFHSLTSSP